MISFEWNDDYSVGNPVLDKHHQTLLKLFNDAYDALIMSKPFGVTSRIIGELTSYSIFHFYEEEKLMLEANYKGYEQHKKEHSEFVKKIKEFKENMSLDNKALNEEIFLFLYNWLVNHIEVSDKKYAEAISC